MCYCQPSWLRTVLSSSFLCLRLNFFSSSPSASASIAFYLFHFLLLFLI